MLGIHISSLEWICGASIRYLNSFSLFPPSPSCSLLQPPPSLVLFPSEKDPAFWLSIFYLGLYHSLSFFPCKRNCTIFRLVDLNNLTKHYDIKGHSFSSESIFGYSLQISKEKRQNIQILDSVELQLCWLSNITTKSKWKVCKYLGKSKLLKWNKTLQWKWILTANKTWKRDMTR